MPFRFSAFTRAMVGGSSLRATQAKFLEAWKRRIDLPR